MSDLLLNKAFSEHHNYPDGEFIGEEIVKDIPAPIIFLKKKEAICVEIKQDRTLHTNYYIGVDWIAENQAVYVEPKLNKSASQTDYLQMLFSALKHPEIAQYTDGLFEIKWEGKQISITQQQDLLTPLLVVQFLRVVQQIVRKGLKKSYYKVEQNLYSRVKGKILVGQTIKQNLLKNKPLNTYCTYDEFGINGLENRLIKKALLFVRRYMPTLHIDTSRGFTAQMFNYIMPAFENVSDEVSLNDCKHTKTNVFYKEYEEGIRLAKLILKRFGYNITNTQQSTVQTPPFGIDMSKLFELYVLGNLMDKYTGEIEYQFQANYGRPDYLLKKQQVVVDAKYKTYYKNDFSNLGRDQKDAVASDIRQISGYARDTKVLSMLGVSKDEQLSFVPKCLIIYPDMEETIDLIKTIDFGNLTPIKGWNKFYKLGVRLPLISDILP
jgi:5-methylcytosine-specific restriction enzyme subunit McrC